ncbi:hypothetical protein B0T19DRAFT_405815 [Cercophora scortea]|uniref:Secreted protein n=1 Tax=Cercophora scortea TaxID=314031 RepID=A0AAE0J2U0_9PEZI|nr:hypothetical protein B0T19DRAFT_405815 [Cercophora scortea]
MACCLVLGHAMLCFFFWGGVARPISVDIRHRDPQQGEGWQTDRRPLSRTKGNQVPLAHETRTKLPASNRTSRWQMGASRQKFRPPLLQKNCAPNSCVPHPKRWRDKGSNRRLLGLLVLLRATSRHALAPTCDRNRFRWAKPLE